MKRALEAILSLPLIYTFRTDLILYQTVATARKLTCHEIGTDGAVAASASA
jgi:hypothetical protein